MEALSNLAFSQKDSVLLKPVEQSTPQYPGRRAAGER